MVSSGSNIPSSIHPAPTRLGVAIAACGASALTATPWPSHSLAAATVSRLSAALVEPYADPDFAGLLVGYGGPGGISAANVVTLRIQPRPRSRIPPMTSVMSSHGAWKLTCSIAER